MAVKLVLIMVLLLWISPLQAANNHHVVIVGGGKTKADAEKVIGQFGMQIAVIDSKTSLEYPKIVRSNTIPGLNPGLYIVVLGVCMQKEAAELKKFLSRAFPGVYVKKVRGSHPSSCPSLSAFYERTKAERELYEAVVNSPSSTDARYKFAFFLHLEGRFEEAEKELEVIIKLNPGEQRAKELLQKIMVLRTD